ncbi:hypothetical protein [Membranihabitans maritimus]|uniref:hypothetical protein n=1 Tax=Membranihabitans maritimus TaxID=2904244 RepID=UPI001F16E675|nr:hypothetical protein [Membranihabitans maritimus]
MSRTDLITLIDKYLNAETSLEEEYTLKREMMRSDVPEEYHYLKEVFSYFDAEKQHTEIPDFDNPANSASGQARVISFSWIYAAASVVILIGLFVFINKNTNTFDEDTFQSPDIAAENAAQALEYFSYQMKKGTDPTLKNVKELDNLNKYIAIFNQ